MLNKKQLDCYKVAAFAQPLIVLGGWLPSTLRQRSSDGFITHCKGGTLDSAMIARRQAQGAEYRHLLVLYRSRPDISYACPVRSGWSRHVQTLIAVAQSTIYMEARAVKKKTVLLNPLI